MLTLYLTVQTRKATLYSMNSWTAKNWNNSFTQIEYRAGAVDLEKLNPSRQSWIFTSVSVDCRFQFSYLLFHFSYGPNICLHCTKCGIRDARLSVPSRRSFASSFLLYFELIIFVVQTPWLKKNSFIKAYSFSKRCIFCHMRNHSTEWSWIIIVNICFSEQIFYRKQSLGAPDTRLLGEGWKIRLPTRFSHLLYPYS